jgi:hypothetical protein
LPRFILITVIASPAGVKQSPDQDRLLRREVYAEPVEVLLAMTEENNMLDKLKGIEERYEQLGRDMLEVGK